MRARSAGRGRLKVAAAIVAIVLTGCDTTDHRGEPATPGPSSRPPPPSLSGGATTRTAAAPTTLTLSFAGDLNFDQQLAALLDDPRHRLATVLRQVLANADLSMLNLETAITTRGSPEPKTYHFRAPASALAAVASTGVDVVTMANNHAVDYGLSAFSDTLAAKDESPIPIVGIGHDAAEAFAPAVLHRAGLSIAIIGSTEIDDLTLNKFPVTESSPGVATNLDPARLLAAVRTARRAYDLVVVYLHWGLDYTSCPDALQPSVAAKLAAAGADVIVGSHAHRVQGAGWLGGSFVSYGLGNFVWARNDGDNGVSGVLTLTVDVRSAAARRDATETSVVTRARWTPLLIGYDGLPRSPAPSVGADLRGRWRQARSCTDLEASPP